MRVFKLVLAYDGSAYSGWQCQPGRVTLQGTLERALAKITGEAVRVTASGRTDAGVHALGQVAAFDSDRPRTPQQVRDGLNAHLPPDVACVEAEVVADDFDPRRATKEKLYRYVFVDRPARAPLRRARAWHVRDRLDVEAMDRAAEALIGTHDFTSFRAAGCTANHPVRTIPSFRVERVGDEVHLLARGHGFLRHMVRNVVGTLVDVGRGRKNPDDMRRILESRNRALASATAPPHGLTLWRVGY